MKNDRRKSTYAAIRHTEEALDNARSIEGTLKRAGDQWMMGMMSIQIMKLERVLVALEGGTTKQAKIETEVIELLEELS
jgi:hypothetical protein